MQEVKDPNILAQLNSASAPASPPGLKEVTDPAILNQLNTSNPIADSKSVNLSQAKDTSQTGALGKIYSAASGLSTGIAEGVNAMGTLANNILKSGAHLIYGKDSDVEKGLDIAGNIGQAGINKVKELVAPTPGFSQQAVQENPHLYGLSGMLGNIGAQTGVANKALNAGANVVGPLANKLIPGLAKSPILSEAASQGALGAGVGAASNPEHPLQGAAIGGALGAIGGGVVGAIKEPVNTAGKIIHDTVQDMVDQGKDPHSLASLRVIQDHLKNEGVVFRKEAVEKEARAAVSDLLDTIRPNGFTPGTNPLPLIANRTLQNATKVVEENKLNYAPINNATDLFNAPKFQSSLATIKSPKIQNLMPEPLKETATLNDMLAYRRQLDGTIKQAKSLASNAKINNTDLVPLYKARIALNDDIHTNAASIGLQDQLTKAEQYNQTYVQPFKLIDKTGNVINNPTAENKIWSALSSQLQARRPNFSIIRANAARLGTEGKELLGWGVLENSLNRATEIAGNFKDTEMQASLKRLNASGILDELGTPTQKQVAFGMSKVLEAAKRNAPAAAEPGIIARKLQLLTHSRLGIGLLKRIGQPGDAKGTATLIGSLLNGIKGPSEDLLTGATANIIAAPDISTEEQ